MKLHLPKKLFSALLTCCTMVSSIVTTTASSTMLVGALTFTLLSEQSQGYTWTWKGGGGNNNISNAANMLNESLGQWEGDETYQWDGPGNQGFLSGTSNGQNVLEFVGEYTVGGTTTAVAGTLVLVDFNTPAMGGLYVQTEAIGFSIAPNGSNTRDIVWNASASVDSAAMGGVNGKINFVMNEDFSFGNGGSGTWDEWFYTAGANYDIAAGKTFTIYANQMLSSGDAPATPYEHLIQGGGTLKLILATNYNLSDNAKWSISQGSTMDLSSITAGTTANLGTVTISNGTINMGANGATLSSALTVGTLGGTVQGSNITLTGSINYSLGGPALNISGSVTLDSSLVINLGNSGDLANGTYTLFTRDNDTSTLDYNLAQLTITGLGDPLRIQSLEWVDDELTLVVGDSLARRLTLETGDATWNTDTTNTPWDLAGADTAFVDGDVVTIGTTGEPGGTITLVGDLAPASTVVQGDGAWVFTGDGSIADGTLTVTGNATLTIETTNSYDGGTILTGGTTILAADTAVGTGDITLNGASAVLEIAHATGLGDAAIRYTAGTIRFSDAFSTSLHDKITLDAAATSLSLDLNGQSITWAEAVTINLNLSNSDTVNESVFNYGFTLAGRTVTLGDNTVLNATVQTAAAGVSLSGTGTLRVDYDAGANYTLGATTGFTGVFEAHIGGVLTFLNNSNTANDRFHLSTETTAAAATNLQAIVLGSNNWAANSTLFLRGLTGYSNISTSNGTPINRGINILMTEDNTYHGDLFTAANDGRWGTWTIGGDGFTFSWTGQTTLGGTNYTSIGTNAKLLITDGATMDFATNDAGTGGGQWADEIEVAENATLLISRTDTTGFVQQAAGNEISGAGQVAVSGNATLSAANTYTGGTVVRDGGTLIAGSATTLGTGAININTGGTLTAGAGLTSAAVVTNEGQLTLGGRVQLSNSIVNTGTITLGADTVLDLSTLAASAITVVDPLTTTYAFATGAGTVDFSDYINAEGFIDITKITGVAVAGRQWSINEEGLLTALVVANNLYYTGGGTLDINNGTIYDGGAAFESGDIVFVSDAPANFNVTEAVQFALIDVDGTSLSIAGLDNSLTVDLLELRNGATLEIIGNVMADGFAIQGGAGNELILNLGATGSVTEQQLATFEGALTIASGSFSSSSPANYESVTVTGGTLSLQAGTGIGTNIALEGGTLSFEDGGEGNFTGAIYTGDGSTIEVVGADNTVTGTWADANIWSGEGTVYKTGAGILSVDMIVSHRGTLDIVEGAYYFGQGEANGADIGFTKVIVREGATFRFAHNNSAQMQNTTFVLDGGTFVAFDSLFGDNRIGALEVTGDSDFNGTFNGNYSFETVTGSSNLTFGGAINEALGIDFKNIVDYNGTINLSANANLLFNIKNVNQAAGNELIIDGAAFSANDGLSKTGAGSLVIENNVNITGLLDVHEGQLSINATASADGFRQLGNATTEIDSLTLSNNGLLNMNYEGMLTIDNFIFGEIVALNYTDATNLLTLTEAQLNGVTSLKVLVSELDVTILNAGIDLGIDADIARDLLSIEGYTDDTTFELTQDAVTGTWHLSATVGADLGWDPNWGIEELAKRPTIVTVVPTVTDANLSLFGDPDTYVSNNIASVKVEGGGSATTRLVGGLYIAEGATPGATVTGDTWIEVAGGTFHLVIGGNYSNNWNAAERADFTGNSHIYMTGGTVDFIFGGNFRDGDGVPGGDSTQPGPTFTGDVFISVTGGTLQGGIFGGMGSTHGANSTMIGDVNIAVYTPISTTAGNVDTVANTGFNIISGGAIRLTGTTGGYNQVGNNHVLVDLSGYTGAAANFAKHIIGGSSLADDFFSIIDGDTSVEIVGHENVTFTFDIFGGQRAQGTATTNAITGNTYVNISGGSTFSDIYGGNLVAGGSATIEGDTHVNISGTTSVTAWVQGSGITTGGTNTINGDTYVNITSSGTFGHRVTAAADHQGGTGIISGKTNLTTNGGVFSNALLGGFNQHTGTTSIENGTKVHILGATFNNTNANAAAIAAGGLHAAGTMTVNGGTHLIIDDITFAAGVANRNITGGVVIEGAGTTTINGGVLVDINGGTFVTELYGGHIVGGASTGVKTITGGIEVNISGDTFSSIVGGAGKISSSAAATDTVTGTTEINISGGSFSNTIVAGYNVVATGAITANVDDLVLNFSGGTMTAGRLVGGHQITGSGTVPTITSGDMTVNVTGGTVNNIYGGSVVGRTGTLAQNDITVNLSGGTVAGNVYAAGLLSALATVTTESTTVNLSDSVTFSGTNVVVSGMYDDATVGGHLSTVAGESKLNLNTEGSTYGNIADVNFEDFSEINVVATSSASIKLSTESLTKKGAGSLSLTTGLTNTAVDVALGSLTMSGTNSLTTLEVASGATLSLAGTTTSITTSLLLNGGSSLTIAKDDTAIAMAAGATASITGAHLNINDYTLGENLTKLLFGDLTSLEGVTLEELFNGEQGIKANEVLGSINGEAISEDFYLVVRGDDIVLLNTLVAKLTWQGGSGDLNADNWQDEDGIDTPFTEFASVTFNSGTGDITVIDTTADELTSIIVTGTTTDYNFVTATDATLLVQSSIEVLDGATASFEVALNTSEANVTVAENSTLNISGTDALAMANMTNNGTITITNATTTQIEALSGTGTLTAGGTVTLGAGTTSGATLDVENLVLADAANSFAQLEASGTVTNLNSLTVGGTSSIGTLTGGGALGIVSGGTLTLANGASISSLENEGTLTVTTGNLTITGAVTDGGDVTITAGDLDLSGVAGTDVSFGKLLVTGNVTDNAGVLSLGDGSIITGSLNGGGLSTTGTVSIGSVAATGLDSLTNGTGTLTIGSDLTVTGEFTNDGSLELVGTGSTRYNATFGTAIANGGNLIAANVTLGGDSVFTQLDASGTVTLDGLLTVGAGSTITSLDAQTNGGGLVVSAGNVTVGNVSGELDSLSNSRGTLTVSSDVTVTGAFSNEGTLSMTGYNLVAQTAIETGGAVTANNVTLSTIGNNAFTSINADGAISAGALSVTADSSATSLSAGMVLDVKGGASFTVSGASNVDLGYIIGEGNFSVTHADATFNLRGKSFANSLSIASGQLTLGGELTLTAGLTLSPTAQSSIALNFALDGAESAITASQLGVSSTGGLNIAVTAQRLDALNLGDGATYTVAELGAGYTGNLLLNGSTGVLEGATGVYEYVLGTDTEGNIIITATIQGNTWEGTAGSVWDSTTAGNWSDNVPSGNLEALFKGDDGIRNVQLVGNNLVAQSVIISADEDGTFDPAQDYYNFSGDKLTTGSLSVSSGLLIVENSIDITSDSNIVNNGTGSLELGAATQLEINDAGYINAEKSNLASNSEVTIAGGGELFVEGALNMAASAIITNDGTLSTGDGSSLSTVTGGGQLYVGTGMTVADSITQGSVNISTGATLRVTDTATITGNLTNNGTIDATGATVNVTEAVTQGGNIMAQTLNVSGQGASFGSVQVDFLNLTGDFVSASTALITVDSLRELTAGNKVTMGIDQLDSTVTGNGSYLIVGKAAGTTGSLSWSDVIMDSTTRDEMNNLIYAGHDITYTTEDDGSLSMLIEDATDRRWLMSNNFAVTEGKENNEPTVKIEPIVNNMTGDITTGISGDLSRYDILDSVERVVIDTDYNLSFANVTLQPGDTQGLLLNNLSGLADKTLTLTGNASGDSLATMRNDTNTSFDSLVLDNMKVQVESSNESILSMNNLDANGSTVTVQTNGGLYVADANFDAASQLVVSASQVIMDRVTLDSGSAEVVSDGIYTVTEKLTMLGDANMELSDDSGGEIAAAELSANAQIDVITSAILNIDSITMTDDSSLNVGYNSAARLGSVTLEGNATLNGNINGKLTIEEISSVETNTLEGWIGLKDGSYTGSYGTNTIIFVTANTGLELATSDNLNLHGGADANVQLNLTDTSKSIASLQTTGSNIVLAGEGSLTLSDSSVSSSMTGGSLSFSMDSSTLLSSLETGSTVETQKVFATGSNVTLSDVELIIQQSDKSTVLDISNIEGSEGLILADVNTQTGTDGNTVSLSGVALQKYFVNARYENGKIVADLNDAAYSPLGVTPNGRTGIALINGAFLKLNPQLQEADGTLANPDLAKVLDVMDVYLSQGNKVDADKLAASVAGASSTALGSALASDTSRQLRSIRNRTMSMGSNPYVSYDDPMQANGWIVAEGDYSKLDNDSTASGHQVNNWGGTLGIDWNLNRELTIGAALTGMYSTVTSNVADSMEGDISSQYITLFSRVNAGRWSHSFIFSTGIANASITRTVNVGNEQYESSGDTDGYSLGFLYEVGYTIALNDDSSTAWQPLLSISYQQSELGGYTENGSDASLIVGDQSVSYFSIAAGARLETVVGENVYDRASVLSFRALVKADFGDLSSEADVAFRSNTGVSGVIEGTERGAFGFEVGAGLMIPIMDEHSQIFMDANVDIRDNQTTINATVGYGFSF